MAGGDESVRSFALWLVLVAVLGAVWFGHQRVSISGQEHQNPAEQRGEQVSPADAELPGGFSEEAIGRLERWLKKTEGSSSRLETSSLRDIFRTTAEPIQMKPPSSDAPESEPQVAAGLPRLTGFVLEGAHGGPVAAIRYEGRMWLVEVGNSIGRYRVEKLVAGEEVVLVEVESGEELLLSLN
jgi:hypothetical protein